jgi:hypothetical protein
LAALEPGAATIRADLAAGAANANTEMARSYWLRETTTSAIRFLPAESDSAMEGHRLV